MKHCYTCCYAVLRKGKTPTDTLCGLELSVCTKFEPFYLYSVGLGNRTRSALREQLSANYTGNLMATHRGYVPHNLRRSVDTTWNAQVKSCLLNWWSVTVRRSADENATVSLEVFLRVSSEQTDFWIKALVFYHAISLCITMYIVNDCDHRGVRRFLMSRRPSVGSQLFLVLSRPVDWFSVSEVSSCQSTTSTL